MQVAQTDIFGKEEITSKQDAHQEELNFLSGECFTKFSDLSSSMEASNDESIIK